MAFCTHCGQQMDEQAKFCSHCGKTRQETTNGQHAPAEPMATGGYQIPDQTDDATYSQGGYQIPGTAVTDQERPVSSGYSSKTQDPAFAAYAKRQKKYGWITLVVLGAIALIAIFIFSGESLGLALMTWAFVVALTALLTLFSSRKSGKSWEGVLEDKRVVVQRSRDSEGYSSSRQVPTLTFRKADGKKEKVQLSYQNNIYDYYQVGDPVRKHPHFSYPEKYYKGETVICLNCGKLISRQKSQCPKCKLMTIV